MVAAPAPAPAPAEEEEDEGEEPVVAVVAAVVTAFLAAGEAASCSSMKYHLEGRGEEAARGHQQGWTGGYFCIPCMYGQRPTSEVFERRYLHVEH